MSVLRRHPLVRAEAIDWYEDPQPDLGLEFAADFLSHYRHLARNAQLYAVRFADTRRLNLGRFPYGLFYVIRDTEILIWIPRATVPGQLASMSSGRGSPGVA